MLAASSAVPPRPDGLRTKPGLAVEPYGLRVPEPVRAIGLRVPEPVRAIGLRAADPVRPATSTATSAMFKWEGGFSATANAASGCRKSPLVFFGKKNGIRK